MGGMPGGRRTFGVAARTRGWLMEVDGLADGLASSLRVLRVADGLASPLRVLDEPLASSEPESGEGEGLTCTFHHSRRTAAPGPFGFAGAASAAGDCGFARGVGAFETRANMPEPLAFFCAGPPPWTGAVGSHSTVAACFAPAARAAVLAATAAVDVPGGAVALALSLCPDASVSDPSDPSETVSG